MQNGIISNRARTNSLSKYGIDNLLLEAPIPIQMGVVGRRKGCPPVSLAVAQLPPQKILNVHISKERRHL